MSYFSAFLFLTFFCLDHCQMEIDVSAQHLCHWLELTYWCMSLRVMEPVKLQSNAIWLCPTYIQHWNQLMRSFYRSIFVIAGSHFEVFWGSFWGILLYSWHLLPTKNICTRFHEKVMLQVITLCWSINIVILFYFVFD